MAVEVMGVAGSIDGYGDSMEAFRAAHEQNTAALLNVAEGKKKNAPRQAYNPNDPVNQWPTSVYHPEKGQMVVGQSIVGVADTRHKSQIVRDNEAELAAQIKSGWRREPYQRPQIAVLDPATEKKALMDKNSALEGMIVAQADLLAKLQERLAALEGK